MKKISLWQIHPVSLFALLVLLLYSYSESNAQKMYWTDVDTDKIQRADLDGSDVEDLIATGLSAPLGIAVDVTANKMYWTDGSARKIQRANLDGSHVEDLVTVGLSAPVGIALDTTAGKIYWADDSAGKIQRANLNGTFVEDLVTGLGNPHGIALDTTAGKIYWTAATADKIQRANLDGGDIEDLVTTGLGDPDGIVLDTVMGKMYWADDQTGKIQRANLDGTSVEDLGTGLGNPFGIALDTVAGKMYWTNYSADKIRRANLDGSNIEDLVSGLSEPRFITVTPVDLPVAHPQNVTTQEDNPIVITLTGSHGNGSPLMFAVATQPTNGMLTGTEPNLTYTPNSNFNGSDPFTFTVSDGKADSAPATVSITVTSENDAPILSPVGDQSIPEDTPLVLTLTATDPDTGDILTFSASSDSADVKATINGSQLTLTPANDFNGTANVTVTVTDDGNPIRTDSETFALTVTPVNDAPTISTIVNPAPILEDAGGQTIALSGIGTGATNETQTLTVTAESSDTALIPQPTVTYTTPQTTGTLVYTPVADASGTVTITVTVIDGGGTSNGGVDTTTIRFSVNVTSVNDPPVFDLPSPVADQTVEEGSPSVNMQISGVSPGGGADEANQQVTLTTESSNSSVVPAPTITGTGATRTLTFQPSASGNAVITVTATDDGGPFQISSKMFTIKVTPIGVPIAHPQDPTTQAGDLITITLTGNDPDNNPLTFMVVTPPTNGTVTGTAPDLIYTPNFGFTGTDRFTFKVNNGQVDSLPATVSITVSPKPTLSIGDATVGEGNTGAIDAIFAVTLSAASDETVTVNYTTADDTARSDTDYVATSGTLTFNPNETSQSITITVNGDTTFETDETFFVNLTDATDATLANDRGKGTITNDDSPPSAPLGINAPDTAQPGEQLDIEIYAGDEENPVTNLFGVSFQFVISHPNLLSVENQDVTKGDFLGSDALFFPNVESGLVSVGISRKGGTDAEGINGTGTIAHLMMTVSDSLDTSQEVTLSLEQVTANDPEGGNIPLTPKEATIQLVAFETRGETSPTTNLLVVEGSIQNPDDSSAESGLRVTINVEDNPAQEVLSTDNGLYSATFFNPLATVAEIGDTVEVSVSRPTTSETAFNNIVLTSEEITNQSVTVNVRFSTNHPPEFDLSIPEGISMIHIPLKVIEVDGKPMEINTIGNLYDAIGKDNLRFIITYDPSVGTWRSFLGDVSRGTPADPTLTDEMGAITVMKNPTILRLKGEALGTNGTSQIRLNPGTNLVGVPLRNETLVRVSNLLNLDGIKDNATAIMVSDEEKFKVVAQTGDDGDIRLTGGQSFMVIARTTSVTEITGVAWDNVSGPPAAPKMPMIGHHSDEMTPVLAVHGTVASDVVSEASNGYRVTIKNLTTGVYAYTILGSEGHEGSYSVTFVDLTLSRAARIGDTLEITVQTPTPNIGVRPLRHIISTDDVKISRIQLPNLIAYRIPTATKLLANYPNPFNPETWIPYQLATDAHVKVEIYNIRGELVRYLDLGVKPAGYYLEKAKAGYWDGRNHSGEQVASGVYFYHIFAGRFNATNKMSVMK